MLSPVSTWVGDRLTASLHGKTISAQNQALGLLSLSLPSVAGWNEYPAKAGEVNRCIAWYTSPYPWSRSVMLVPGWTGWLAEITADLQEVVPH